MRGETSVVRGWCIRIEKPADRMLASVGQLKDPAKECKPNDHASGVVWYVFQLSRI